jgi:hypothetical protein
MMSKSKRKNRERKRREYEPETVDSVPFTADGTPEAEQVGLGGGEGKGMDEGGEGLGKLVLDGGLVRHPEA